MKTDQSNNMIIRAAEENGVAKNVVSKLYYIFLQVPEN